MNDRARTHTPCRSALAREDFGTADTSILSGLTIRGQARSYTYDNVLPCSHAGVG
jgi:hypothetical protein